MLKFYIEKSDYSGHINIFIVEEQGEKRFVAKKVNLEFVEIHPYKSMSTEDSGPTLQFPIFDAHNLLKDLAEELDKNGIQTDKDAKIAGTLEATKYHLEDLRTLLKLRKE